MDVAGALWGALGVRCLTSRVLACPSQVWVILVYGVLFSIWSYIFYVIGGRRRSPDEYQTALQRSSRETSPLQVALAGTNPRDGGRYIYPVLDWGKDPKGSEPLLVWAPMFPEKRLRGGRHFPDTPGHPSQLGRSAKVLNIVGHRAFSSSHGGRAEPDPTPPVC